VVDNDLNSSAYAGIYLSSSSGLLIENNRINSTLNYTYGIWSSYTDYVRLSRNTIRVFGFYAYAGLYFDQSRFWNLRNNSFPNQYWPILFNYNPYSLQVQYFIHDADTSNTVNGLPLLWIVNATTGSWNASYGWIALVNSSNIFVTSTSPLIRNVEGVLLVGTNDSTVHDVNASANQNGMRLWISHRNRINDTQVRANVNLGIYLWDSNGNAFNRPLLRPDTPGTDYGLWFADTSNNNTVEAADCQQFTYCVYEEYLTNDIFLANSTLDAAQYGVYSYSQSGPWISHTTITNSGSAGIQLNGAYYTYYNVALFAISNTSLAANYYGVQCYYCAGGLITDTDVNASAYIGIYISYSSGLVIQNTRVLS